ncbi:MAG TPA: carboxypeptidase-like regulatory domain-containing protein [Terracidiphilus sp.]|nr:carboxypeptidase-like regulatory domain-containing protein [Terracidiphilus sp.]
MKEIARKLTQERQNWKRGALLTLIAGIAAALSCPWMLAQSGEGSIQGTVTDSTGAVIPAAAVSAVNTATNVAASTKTNGVGFYTIPGLNTGTYVVTVTAQGMESFKQTIELLVAQNFVLDAKLTAGAVTQQVTVSGSAVQLVTTDNGAITSTLENARINQLPMNGRNIITLVNETTPGLESCPESSSCANGLEGPATVYEVDGASLEDREFGGVHKGSQQMVDPDAIQEVRVEDEDAGAQYAAPATAIINTKSGTNSLHGTAFWTARNNAFGVARNRQTPANQPATEYIRNEAGASLGGPIVIPHLYHGKNKSFFFFAYERYSLANSPAEDQATPTQAMRNGDFSGLINSSNVLQTLYDPYTTTGSGASTTRKTYTSENNMGTNNPNCASATNCIPTSQENALYKTFMAMTPLPTPALANVDPLAGDNLDTQYYELSVIPQYTARIDQVFNENNRAYLRFTRNSSSPITARADPAQAYTLAATAPGGGAIPKWVSGAEYQVADVNAAALGYTHIFSPTFFAETVYNMTWFGENTWAGPVSNANYESELGLPNNFGEEGFPIVGSGEVLQPFDGTQFNYDVTYTDYSAEENLTKILGKHQLLFGGRYFFEHLGSLPDRSKDELEFDGDGTGLLNSSSYSSSAANSTSNTGNDNADEFIGSPYNYSVNLQTPYEHLHDMETDAYIQDNWHARNNLTINLGVRWESHPATWQGQGAMLGFDSKAFNSTTGVHGAIVTSGSLAQLESEGITTAAIVANDENLGVTFETPTQAGLPSMLVKNYNLDFLPRVGIAWQPFGKWGTVLRGGFGRYDYPVPVRESYREEDENNPFNVGFSANYTSNTYTPHAGYLLLAAPNSSSSFNYNTTNATTGAGTPLMGFNSANVVNSASTTAINPGLGNQYIDPDYPPDFIDEANFTIEQPTKWGSVIRVSYIYTHGTNLGNYWYFNNHPSTYSWEIQQDAVAPSASGSSILNPQNSSTGMGPYDNLVYGSGLKIIQKTGWSNYNGLQAVYQKLYRGGSAWQIMYVWSKNLRTGGDYGGEGGDYVDPYINYVNSYVGGYVAAGNQTPTVSPVDANAMLPAMAPALPPPPPAGVGPAGYYKALNRWENYMVDNNSPPQHLQFNGLLDLPFGRGKRWLSNINKPLNEAVGGWQVAGAGTVQFTDFYPTTTNWGPTAGSGAAGNSLHLFKKKAKIQDCRSGICKEAYEWFNGYIPPSNLSSTYTVAGQAGCAGSSTKTINNLPTSWQPYQTPMDVYCTPNGSGSTTDKYFGDNDVLMSNVAGQKNGTEIGYGDVPGNNDNGSSESAIDVTNPFGHTALAGPWEWSADASLFKVFPITERFNVRMNVDAFNVFNHQGFGNPSSTDGTTCYSAGGVGCDSYNSARTLQLSLRVNY